jgi:hypothetical protein
MMPADLQRLHKYMLEIESIDHISDEMRAVVESEWPELVHKPAAEETSGRIATAAKVACSPSGSPCTYWCILRQIVRGAGVFPRLPCRRRRTSPS